MMFVAELAMVVWLHCHDVYKIGVPMPVIIQSDSIIKRYSYSNNGTYISLQNAIVISEKWNGSCDDQKRFVELMTEHYYNWASRKLPRGDKKEAAKTWECLQ